MGAAATAAAVALAAPEASPQGAAVVVHSRFEALDGAARTFAAEAHGAAPGADPGLNTRAIQAALAEAAAQGGVATVTAPGTFDLATQGPNPYRRGHRFCLDVAGNDVTLRIGPRSVLRLADGQQSDAGGPVDLVILTGNGVAVDGGGAIEGNTSGQKGWTRGYAQNENGNLVSAHAGRGRGGERLRIEDLTLADAFSNAVLTTAPAESPTRGVTIARVRARDTGEGPMVVNATDVRLLESSFENRRIAHHPGDGFELSNVSSFEARDLTVRGRLGGSAIDLYGARDGRLERFLLEDVVEGVMIQENGTYGTYSESVVVADGLVRVVGPEGNGVWTKGRKVRNVIVSGVRVLGPNRGTTYGFQVAADNVPQEGPVTLRDCQAKGHTTGLLVKTVAGLTVEGGEYSDNRSSRAADGIHWVGQTAAGSADDTRGLVIRDVRAGGNSRHGIHLDYRDVRGRFRSGQAPSGALSGCRLSGNGGRGLAVTSAPDPRHNLAAQMAMDDIEPNRRWGRGGPVAGLRVFSPSGASLATLAGPHQSQVLVLAFERRVRVVDACRPGGRDLHLHDHRTFTAQPGARLCLQWDGTRWQELWREPAAGSRTGRR